MLIFLVFYVAFCLLCLSSSCVLYTQCRQFLWIVFVVCLVYPMSPVSLDCLRFLWIVFVVCLVYPMSPVSLDCLRRVSCVLNVASFSGLSIPDFL